MGGGWHATACVHRRPGERRRWERGAGGSKTWTENLSGFENAERRGTEMKRTTSPVFREEGYHVFRGAPAGLLVLADTGERSVREFGVRTCCGAFSKFSDAIIKIIAAQISPNCGVWGTRSSENAKVSSANNLCSLPSHLRRAHIVSYCSKSPAGAPRIACLP